MKFEDYLAEQGDDKQKHQHQRRHVLEEEVKELQADLDEQQAIGKVLQSALHGPVLPPHPCIASLLPPQVQGLLAEMAIVEEEIMWLERKVNDLKVGLYYERKLTKKHKAQHNQRRKSKQQNHLPVCEAGANRSVLVGDLYQVSRSQRHGGFRKERFKFRRSSAGSAEEVLSILPTGPSSSKPKKQHRSRAPMQKEPAVPYHIHRDIILRETK
ncbi:hypothetical protein LINPERHAP1_LOCUS2917 [Linum perenne]